MRVSQGLRDLEIRRGDVAAIWFQNDPNWLVAFLACARVGANAIALNTRFRQAELPDVFERLAPWVIFYQQSFREMDFSAVVDGACRASGLKNILEIFDTAPAAGTRLTVQDLIDRTGAVKETSFHHFRHDGFAPSPTN